MRHHWQFICSRRVAEGESGDRLIEYLQRSTCIPVKNGELELTLKVSGKRIYIISKLAQTTDCDVLFNWFITDYVH